MVGGDPIPGASGSEGQVSPGAENSTEVQNRALLDELRSANQKLEGRLFWEFPTDDGKQVLLFNHVKNPNMGQAERFDGGGVHSEAGPVLVRKGVAAEANQAARKIRDGHQAQVTWGSFTTDMEKGLTSVNDETTFKVWKEIYDTSVLVAKHHVEWEAAKRQFLPRALEAVRANQ